MLSSRFFVGFVLALGMLCAGSITAFAGRPAADESPIGQQVENFTLND